MPSLARPCFLRSLAHCPCPARLMASVSFAHAYVVFTHVQHTARALRAPHRASLRTCCAVPSAPLPACLHTARCRAHTQASMSQRKRRMKAGRVAMDARYCQKRMVDISASPCWNSTASVWGRGAGGGEACGVSEGAGGGTNRRPSTCCAACQRQRSAARQARRARLHVEGGGRGVAEQQREQEHGIGRLERAQLQRYYDQARQQRRLQDQPGHQHARSDAQRQARRARAPAAGGPAGMLRHRAQLGCSTPCSEAAAKPCLLATQ